MSASRLSAAICCAFLFGCGGQSGGSVIGDARASPAPVVVVEHLHAIIRPDSTGRWYVQRDVDHDPVGISWELEQTSEYVRVFFFTNYTHAGTIQITSDDDFGGKVQGHSNLGLNSATIRITVDGKRIDPGRILDHVPTASLAGNLWINATMVTKR